jgi:hypothetical protein
MFKIYLQYLTNTRDINFSKALKDIDSHGINITLIQAIPSIIHKYSTGTTTRKCSSMLATILSNKNVSSNTNTSKKKSYIYELEGSANPSNLAMTTAVKPLAPLWRWKSVEKRMRNVLKNAQFNRSSKKSVYGVDCTRVLIRTERKTTLSNLLHVRSVSPRKRSMIIFYIYAWLKNTILISKLIGTLK